MCVQYWPAAKNREEVYGGVGVTVETEEQLANFMIRSDNECLSGPDCWLSIVCVQDNPAEKGRGGAQSDPVPLHGVALSLKPLQQRPAGVQAQGEASDEPAPGDPGRPRDSPLQVRSWFYQDNNQGDQ